MSAAATKIATRKEVNAQAITGVMGELGGRIINDATSYTGDWNCLYPLTDAVIFTATTPDFTGSLNGLTLSAGIPFYGNVTALSLASGTLIAYTRTTTMAFL